MCACCSNGDLSAGFPANNREAQAIERRTIVSLEGFETGRVAIVRGQDFAGAFTIEMDAIVGSRHNYAVRVYHGGSNERDVPSVRSNCCAIRLQLEPGG